MADKNEKKEEKNEKEKDKKNILEWVVFYVSLFIVTGIIGYLTYKVIVTEPSSPDLFIVYTADPSPYAPHRYKVKLKNTGNETAEEVNIELVLSGNGQLIERASMKLPFVPMKSSREGWVNFSINPATADSLFARVISYKKP